MANWRTVLAFLVLLGLVACARPDDDSRVAPSQEKKSADFPRAKPRPANSSSPFPPGATAAGASRDEKATPDSIDSKEPERSAASTIAADGQATGTGAGGLHSGQQKAPASIPKARARPEPPSQAELSQHLAEPQTVPAGEVDIAQPVATAEAIDPTDPSAAEIGVNEPATAASLEPRAGASTPADDDAVADTDSPAAGAERRRPADKSLNCDVIELMGEAIGRWRLRGDERILATDKAIDDVLRITGGVRNEKFVFSGRVYGMLIYQIEEDHTEEGFGAYAWSACRILRGQIGIVPADDASQKRLDESLSFCERRWQASRQLNACIWKRMHKIVREQVSRSG